MTEVGMNLVDFRSIQCRLIDWTKFDSFEKQGLPDILKY